MNMSISCYSLVPRGRETIQTPKASGIIYHLVAVVLLRGRQIVATQPGQQQDTSSTFAEKTFQEQVEQLRPLVSKEAGCGAQAGEERWVFFKKKVVFNESPPVVNAWKGEVYIA